MRMFLTALLLSLSAGLLLGGTTFAGEAEEAVLEEARHDFNLGRYYLTTYRLVRLLREEPSNSHRREILLLMAKAYRASGRGEKAAKTTRELLAEFPDAAASLEPELRALADSGLGPSSSAPPGTDADSPAPEGAPAIAGEAGNPGRLSAPAPLAERVAADHPSPQAVGAQEPSPLAVPGDSGTTAVAAAQEPAVIQPDPKPEENPSQADADAATSPAAPPAGRGEEPFPSIEVARAPQAVSTSEPQGAVAAEERAAGPSAEHEAKGAETSPFPPEVSAAGVPSAPVTSPGIPGEEVQGARRFVLVITRVPSKKKLDTLMTKIREAGLEPVIREKQRSAEVHRVIAGCDPRSEGAEKRRQSLSRLGIESAVIRSEASYCVLVGSFLSEKNALQGKKTLSRKGIAATVVKAAAVLPEWSITAGTFNDPAEAREVARRLALSGVEADVSPADQ